LLSYKWLGHYYFDKGDYDKALENYEVLIKLRAADKKVEDKVAAINVLRDYQSVSKLQPMGGMPNPAQPQGDFQPYVDSAFYFCKTGDTLKAFRMYLAALRLNRAVEKVFSDSSFKSVQYQQFTTAIRQYDLLLKLYTSNPYYYFYRGVGKFSTGQLKPAIADWETAVKMDVKEVQQSASYNLCVAYNSIGDAQKAVYYVELARKTGYAVNEEFAAKLHKKAKK
jgi:tetratricopeptide (TPR) repeat protein